MAWYDAHRTEIEAEYSGMYVAVVDGALVDSDSSFDALARRIYRKLGLCPVYMPKVGASRVKHMRSPRRIRS
jgi:hypothetical protein